MSRTSATPGLRNKSDILSATATDLPPILELPVELRYLIYFYATDEQQWFAPESKLLEPLPLGQNRFGQRHFRDTSNRTLFHRHRAFLTTNASDPHQAQLTCAHPLARVNKQFRIESSEFLRTSAMPIVSRVRDLDFSHVRHFLSTLEVVHQDAFKVQHDGTSGRNLITELQGPYTKSSMENLHRWIEYVNAFTGSEERAEFCALYKAIEIDGPNRAEIIVIVLPPSRYHDAALYRCLPIAALKEVREYRANIAPGSGRIEVNKIVAVLTAWLNQYWV